MRKCHREKCLFGRNVTPNIFDQKKGREKSNLGRNVVGEKGLLAHQLQCHWSQVLEIEQADYCEL